MCPPYSFVNSMYVLDLCFITAVVSCSLVLDAKSTLCIFIVAPCILKMHWVLHTNECTNYTLYISLKFFIKHLKCSYMFRSLDHPQGTRLVPCYDCTLKLWIHCYIYEWCGSISCVCVCVIFSAGRYVDCTENNAYTNTWYAATSLINITTYSQF